MIMLKNNDYAFGSIAKGFHWVMAALFIFMFLIAYTMINMHSDFRFKLYDIHKATGLLLFALVTLRLWWRTQNIQPALPHTLLWQRRLARANIILLYCLMFLLP